MCRVFYATQLGQGVKRSMLDILAPLHGAIFEFMCLQDLAMLQAACGDLRQLVEHEADSAWLSSTAFVLPGFELDPSALFHARRADFLKLLPHLKVAALPQVQASMAWSRAPIRLAGLAEATRLSQRLATARTTAGQHLASGGAYAEVLMAHLALEGPPAGQRLFAELLRSSAAAAGHPEASLLGLERFSWFRATSSLLCLSKGKASAVTSR
ncbi:unnamed protein product [Polarella glacialis]|uniref:Uncharacterized protein n=1 Tax=Polarella glacialis TaxID=89957 RepID=A0A813EPY4_POLGL|nr:unnamed protein product [Polarella glacialis]